MENSEELPNPRLKPLGHPCVCGVVHGVITVCDGAVGAQQGHIRTPGPPTKVALSLSEIDRALWEARRRGQLFLGSEEGRRQE